MALRGATTIFWWLLVAAGCRCSTLKTRRVRGKRNTFMLRRM